MPDKLDLDRAALLIRPVLNGFMIHTEAADYSGDIGDVHVFESLDNALDFLRQHFRGRKAD